ncbi:cytospin-A-like isoform X2 [Vanacampus margaritifer]
MCVCCSNAAIFPFRSAPSCADTIKPCIIMGNINYRPSADFFQTPAMPSEVDLTAMALSSRYPRRSQTPSLEMAAHASLSTTLAVTDWAQRLSPPSEWAILSLDGGVKSPNGVASGAELAGERQRAGDAGRRRREVRGGAESGLAGPDGAPSYLRGPQSRRRCYGGSYLVRQLIAERDKLVEEVNSLRETLNNEKSEWQQFQLDLLATVSAADRLRCDSEQALGQLQDDRKSLQEELAEAHAKQLETLRELECLRSQHTDVWFKLSSLEKKRQKVDGRLVEDRSNPAEGDEMKIKFFVEELDVENIPKQEECEAHEEKDAKRSASSQLTAKGIGKAYVDALEKKKNGGGRDPRRILMSSERSLSLSRFPLPVDSCHNNDAVKTSSTLPQSKKEEPTRGKKTSHILRRQDSWTSCHKVLVETSGDVETSPMADVPSQPSAPQMDVTCTKPPLVAAKQVEDPPSEAVKPPDVPRPPLRRFGSTRRTLLNQCQSSTEGYQHIEITNFSTCWEDGLAFCALYHKYLPSLIPYKSLNPAAKKENLDLAFRTGESVGIAATLSVEDMLKDDGPEWRKVQCYVESIFHHFEAELPNTQGV